MLAFRLYCNTRYFILPGEHGFCSGDSVGTKGTEDDHKGLSYNPATLVPTESWSLGYALGKDLMYHPVGFLAAGHVFL